MGAKEALRAKRRKAGVIVAGCLLRREQVAALHQKYMAAWPEVVQFFQERGLVSVISHKVEWP